MKPVLAVIAAGGMGSAVGKRLTENGVRVLTSLEGRSAASAARAKAAGHDCRERSRNRHRRYRAVDRAAGGSVAARAAAGAGA